MYKRQDYENLGPDTIKFALLDDNNAILKGYNNGELDFIENLPVDVYKRQDFIL